MQPVPLASEVAFAKVNLALHVTGRRPDGYHELDSLVVFAEIGDRLDAREATSDRLLITGPFAAALSSGQVNLVSAALADFRKTWPGALPKGLEITLAKNLPVSAGIGGGSADAAAALRLLAGISSRPVDPAGLDQVALRLGADVPVCLRSQACVMRGIGEHLTLLSSFPSCHILLINPLLPIATADIFRRLEKSNNAALPRLPDSLSDLALLGLWLKDTRNDLQAPATMLLPQIEETTRALATTPGAITSRMSGSGATVFALYASAALAHQAAHDMRERFPDYWVAAAPVISPQ